MTNDKARRASGKAMQDARRDSGKAMQDSRRASGDAMVERRTGQSQVADINAVVNQPRPRKQLKPVTPRGALPAQTSPGTDTPNPKPTGGGVGIAWPLIEPDATTREYHPARTVASSDGLIAIRVRALKSINLRDADETEGALEFDQP